VASSGSEHPAGGIAAGRIAAGRVRTGRPLIGLTTYRERAATGVWDTEFALLHSVYVDAVARAGGVPVLLPPQEHGAEEVFLHGGFPGGRGPTVAAARGPGNPNLRPFPRACRACGRSRPPAG